MSAPRGPWPALLLILTSALSGCLGPSPEATQGDDGLPTEPPPFPEIPREAGVHTFNITVDGEPAMSWIANPANQTSEWLVVVCRGFGEDGSSYIPLILQKFSDAGVLAAGMSYRGEGDDWNVMAGAEDTLAATLALQAAHPEVKRTLLVGLSMGGEVSGMAVAMGPHGTYDYWIDIVGVMVLASEWAEVPGFQSVIEEETGGTPTDVPEAYSVRTPLDRVDEIAEQGLARVYMVYGAGDVVVPIEQAERMYAELVQAGVPVSYYVVATMLDSPACVPVVFVCTPALPVGPAGHETYASEIITPIIWDRLAGVADPTDPSVRVVYESATQTDVTLPVPETNFLPIMQTSLPDSLTPGQG